MGSAVADLVALALYGLVGAAVVGLVVWRVVAMSRAATARLSDDECVSCGSRDVTAVGPGAYRCNACGYEGGSGLAAAAAARERAAVEAMAPEARRAAGLADLREALSCLAAAEDRVRAAAPDPSDVEGARTEILRAGEQLRRAGLELGDPLLAAGPEAVDASGFAVATVTDALAGHSGLALSPAARAMAAADAAGLRDRARAMAAAARAALARAGEPPERFHPPAR